MKEFFLPNKRKLIVSLFLLLFALIVLSSDMFVKNIISADYSEVLEGVNEEYARKLESAMVDLNNNTELQNKLHILSVGQFRIRIWSFFIIPIVFSYLFACVIVRILSVPIKRNTL